ncbi:MAG: M48 family metalloprotease [Phycisphaerae bacterium]|nr:M48 family metalloprotease [Phycisphaerae bacterium]
MVWEYLNNSVAAEGFLCLFVNLLILTLVTAVLLIASCKWMSSTRSFLLLGMIVSFVLIIGWNLVFFAQPDNRVSMVSLTLPAIEENVKVEPLLLEGEVSIGFSSVNTAVLDNEILVDTNQNNDSAFWSRLIIAGACIGGIIWLCGSIVFIIRLLANLVMLENFKRKLTPVKDSQLQQMLQKVKTILDLKIRPSLYCSADIEVPMTIGIFKPAIVMPEKLLNVTGQEENLCILAHESGHIKHFDNLAGLLQRIFIALNWWNPLAYIISTRYSLTREEVCDDYAVDMVDNKNRYTTCLVNLAEKSCLITNFKPAVGLVGCKNSLAKRLTRILEKDKTMETKLVKTKKIMLAGLFVAIILGCAGIQTAFAQDYDAVGRRLRAAVQAGEITGEQARIMLGALRKAGEAKDKKGITVEEYRRAEAEMHKMVQEGKAKPEDVERRLIEMRKHIIEQPNRSRKGITVEEYRRAEAEMRKMVEEGKAKPEDVERRLIEMRKEMGKKAGQGEERHRGEEKRRSGERRRGDERRN